MLTKSGRGGVSSLVRTAQLAPEPSGGIRTWAGPGEDKQHQNRALGHIPHNRRRLLRLFLLLYRARAPHQNKRTQEKTACTDQKEGTLLGSGDSRGGDPGPLTVKARGRGLPGLQLGGDGLLSFTGWVVVVVFPNGE